MEVEITCVEKKAHLANQLKIGEKQTNKKNGQCALHGSVSKESIEALLFRKQPPQNHSRLCSIQCCQKHKPWEALLLSVFLENRSEKRLEIII